MPKITTCLWFDSEAEEAARFYVSIFKNASVGRIGRYGTEGREFHGKEPGSVMTVEFELEGHKYLALNGGPQFKFDEAVSFIVDCRDQAEVDYYWEKLTAGGKEVACGWLKDKYGLSWQITPEVLPKLLRDPDKDKANRAMRAMLGMKKIDVAALENAARG
ncbi:MAG: VOC family protein [Alphaproteobacteria bacterium]|nr:VOC family protein [Alphaproteobacteria bacterium]MDE2630344.1 VOC family protein [Alphaproteobacteria bacterium]